MRDGHDAMRTMRPGRRATSTPDGRAQAGPAPTLRRRLLGSGLAAGAALLAGRAFAQTADGWPQRTVKIIVPYPPGGTTDLLARVLAPRLSERLKQSFVVENRAGAGGTIGAQAVARAPADGYTLVMATIATHTLNPVLTKLPYDPLKDFEPITDVADTPNVLLAHPDTPYKSLGDLIAAARLKPGTIAFGSTSPGGSPHMSGELLKSMAKIDLTHVPYKGGAPMLADLIGGQIPVAIDNLPSAMAHIRSGRVRALAITSKQRSSLAPEIPTIAESGVPGYAVDAWFGLLAPTGTPRPIVSLIQRQVAEILKEPDAARQLQDMGAEAVGNTPEAFTRMLAGELEKWGKVVAAAGLKLD